MTMFDLANVLHLCEVDLTEVAAWAEAPDYESWPQQNRLADGALRPAMLPARRYLVAPVIDHVLQVLASDRRGIERPRVKPLSELFSVVMPGHRIDRHPDWQEPAWVCRVHVPILTNTRAWFSIGDVTVHLGPPGQAFAVNTRVPHEIVNDGPTPRLHLMFDVVGEGYRCICGGCAYECARCREKRCMECDRLSTSENVKTAVRWCPTHRHDGERGRL